jgi:hypothetical protein
MDNSTKKAPGLAGQDASRDKAQPNERNYRRAYSPPALKKWGKVVDPTLTAFSAPHTTVIS